MKPQCLCKLRLKNEKKTVKEPRKCSENINSFAKLVKG